MANSIINDIKRVIAVVEPGSETQPAIERLKYLARFVDFDVKLIACDYSQYLVEGYYFSEAELPALRDEYLQERKELLEDLAGPLREGGLVVETEAIWSHPSYKAIVEIVEAYQPDLVIHHVQRHAALSRLLLSSDDWQMARHCPAPLLLVKNKPWKDEPVILAGVDPMHARHKPSGLDHKILSEGTMLAKKLDGELYAAHAYGQFPLSGVYPADAKEQHEAAFNDLADEFDLPPSHRILMDEAPEYAMQKLESELQADLVIVGAVSRSIISDVIIGSTTEKVLDFLDCDALLLRPDS
jgi:universal stress protein E